MRPRGGALLGRGSSACTRSFPCYGRAGVRWRGRSRAASSRWPRSVDALMAGPRLLLLDEPSLGLAPAIVDHVFEVIVELHRAGTAVLLVEQNVGKALAVADPRLVCRKDAASVFERPAGPGSSSEPHIRRARTSVTRRPCGGPPQLWYSRRTMIAPRPIHGACDWRGEEMARSARWIRVLDGASLGEIDAALDVARSAGVPWHETTRERVPLRGLAAMLADVARELEDGGRPRDPARPPGRAVQRRRAPADLVRARPPPRPAGLPEPARRADARDPGRGPCVGERYGQIPSRSGGPASCSPPARARSRTAPCASTRIAATWWASSAPARRGPAGSASWRAPWPCTTR